MFRSFNLKYFAAFLIVILSIVEFVVYNEEVFIFLCFFLFFNLVSVRFGSEISSSLSSGPNSVEKEYLDSYFFVKDTINSLSFIKKKAISLIDVTLFLLKSYRIYTHQIVLKSLILPYITIIENTRINLDKFKSISLEASMTTTSTVEEIFGNLYKRLIVNKLK